MGYRSDVVIAVHKSVLASDLVNPIIPKCLKEQPHHDTKDARYWVIEGWKWYDSYPEILEIEEFFKHLDEEFARIPDSDSPGYTNGVYGAIRIGEEFGDSDTWGDPSDYEIYVNQSIDYPTGK